MKQLLTLVCVASLLVLGSLCRADEPFAFLRGIPASEKKIEIAPSGKLASKGRALVLPVKITNSSTDEIKATIAHEWHGGLWPPTGLYASVTPTKATKEAPFHPVFLVGESSELTVPTLLGAGKSFELSLRMNWPGTGSVPAQPLIEAIGVYRIHFILVFKAAGKEQYVVSPASAVELGAPADDDKPAVSLILSKATAKRGELDTVFRCEAVLDNALGKDLTVRTNFSSVFDGLELVVTNKDGKILAQQPYIWHQAPFSPPGRKFMLKRGTTAATLVFPLRDFPKDAKVVKVRLVGTLPESKYPRILSTETIEVKVEE
jgi:hypothetical protein